MNEELLASYWTHAGNAAPLMGDETSPVPLARRIEIAGRTGWSGMGLVLADLNKAVQDAGSHGALAQHFQANGIKHLELEFLEKWWEGEANESAWAERMAFFRAANALGVKIIKVSSNLSGTDVPFDTYVAELRRMSDQAAEIGCRLAMEFMPFAFFSDARKAAKLIEAADHEAVGLCVDIWHVFRSGMGYDELIECVPHDKMFVVELDDAVRQIQGTLFEDSSNERRYPGDGDFDVAAFVRAITSTGYHGHWGVEIISQEHRSVPIEVGLRRAYDKTVAAVRAAACPPVGLEHVAPREAGDGAARPTAGNIDR
jgi:sugar phosphate isomerase/epimerase